MRRAWLWVMALAVWAAPVAAETADELAAKCVQALGGIDHIQSVRTLRRSGRAVRPGGADQVIVYENARPDRVREEVHRQGMVGVNAWDGKVGWRIQPWQGKKDPEPLGEGELKALLEDADFDGPLVRYREKGNTLALLGRDEFEGTEVFKLRVTEPHGAEYVYFLDAETFVPIKIDTKRTVRGAERRFETLLGNYKQVNGWYLPYAIEVGEKGADTRLEKVYDTIEANVPLDPSRFAKPGTAPAQPQEPRP